MSFQLEPSESLISYPICNTVEALVSVHHRDEKKGSVIDLFTDTAAILNLLDLRSIMGCPGGTRSVFTRAFRAKRELHCIFLGKKAIIITSKHGTTIFFSHYNLFLGKLEEKLARKARVNTERVYRIVLMPPGHPTILLKSNEFNMAAVLVKRSIGAGRLQEWFSYADTKLKGYGLNGH